MGCHLKGSNDGGSFIHQELTLFYLNQSKPYISLSCLFSFKNKPADYLLTIHF